MARGRMISKSLSTSKKFATLHANAGELAEFCQILFTLIVAHADDFGRLSGDTFTVKFAVVPASPRTEPEVGEALGYLRDAGLIRWDGTTIQVEHFDAHQSGLHKRKDRSDFPEVPGISRKSPEAPGNSRLTEQNRTEPNGTEQNGSAAADVPAVDGEFEQFKAAYPSQGRTGGRLVSEAFLTARRSGVSLAAILAALDNHRASEQWSVAGKIPHALKWLQEERWNMTLDPPKATGSGKTAGNAAVLQRFVERVGGGRRDH